MSDVVVNVKFSPRIAATSAGRCPAGPGEVIQAVDHFRPVRRLCRRCYAIVSFIIMCPLLMFGPDSSFRIVDSYAGTRGIFARQRQL